MPATPAAASLATAVPPRSRFLRAARSPQSTACRIRQSCKIPANPTALSGSRGFCMIGYVAEVPQTGLGSIGVRNPADSRVSTASAYAQKN